MACIGKRKPKSWLSFLSLLLLLLVGLVSNLRTLECRTDSRKQKLLEKKKDKGVELGEEEEFLNTWASCNITGPCIRCSKEEEEKDPTSCRKTKHRHEITCIDPGPEGGDNSEARETFVMFEACKVNTHTPTSLGFFISMMFLILICSSPVVAIRKRRAR